MAMKYACCAAKAKVMWLTWMLVMLCRLLLLLLLLGLRLSLKKIEMKIIKQVVQISQFPRTSYIAKYLMLC